MAAKKELREFESLFGKHICILCSTDKVFEEIETKIKRMDKYKLDWFTNTQGDVLDRHKYETVIGFVYFSSSNTVKAKYGSVDFIRQNKWELISVDDIDWNVS